MIRPNELRIGNLVNELAWGRAQGKQELLLPSGRILKVSIIDFDGIEQIDPSSINSIKRTFQEIDPISITEEWLTKFGFIGENNPSAGWNDLPSRYYTGRLLPMRIYLVDFDNHWHFLLEGTLQGLGKFKYVHQLQNLYFALTNEELTLQSMSVKTIIELEAERLAWSLATFLDATDLSSLKKLKKEIEEVEKELKVLHKFPDQDPVNLPEEYADCLMCLFDSAGRAGITLPEIFEAFEEKLAINKERIWRKNKDNTYSHVKRK